ncbi:MAG: hypothetical protein ISS49_04855 [Anaerolineae bacterium]|nr:hypothetical protein [Anaerolineae bacterium]
MKKHDLKAFLRFTVKVVVTHTLTYFIFGLVMSNVFDYARLFQQDIIKDFMRPIDSSYVLAGPFLQPLRGLLFAIALWPIRNLILQKKHGWLILWNILVMVGILSTPAAAPCSVEGVIYSKLPLWYHLLGLPEIMLQTFIFSLVLVRWDKRQDQKTKGPEEQPATPSLLSEIMKAVMTGCFAYIGYAIGGLLSVAIAGIEVDMDAAATDLRTQMMFVVAFAVNVIVVFFISRQWLKGKISIWLIFALFWGIDTVVPLLYQLVFTAPSPLHMALLLGFFPAVIIAVSIYLNYKRPV